MSIKVTPKKAEAWLNRRSPMLEEDEEPIERVPFYVTILVVLAPWALIGMGYVAWKAF